LYKLGLRVFFFPNRVDFDMTSQEAGTYSSCVKCGFSNLGTKGHWICANKECKKELFWYLGKFGKLCKPCAIIVMQSSYPYCNVGNCSITKPESLEKKEEEKVVDKTVEYHSSDEEVQD
jgi:hypothetical protein